MRRVRRGDATGRENCAASFVFTINSCPPLQSGKCGDTSTVTDSVTWGKSLTSTSRLSEVPPLLLVHDESVMACLDRAEVKTSIGIGFWGHRSDSVNRLRLARHVIHEQVLA